MGGWLDTSRPRFNRGSDTPLSCAAFSIVSSDAAESAVAREALDTLMAGQLLSSGSAEAAAESQGQIAAEKAKEEEEAARQAQLAAEKTKQEEEAAGRAQVAA